MLTSNTHLQLPIRSPARFPFGLKFAASFFPGGVKTMIRLAWLSRDERARDVARQWRAIDLARRDGTDLEDLCRAAGMRDADLLGDVMATAFDLGIDVSNVIGGIIRMPAIVEAFYQSAMRSEGGRNRAVDAAEFLDRHYRSAR
jgi:hypothetical protein